MNHFTLIGPFAQIIPMTGIPVKGAVQDKDLVIIQEGGILIKGEHIYDVGPYKELTATAKSLQAEIRPLTGEHVCLPGFIDAHTHICYAGSRANDYALRNAGKTYLEIAASGGGIWDTVTQTRRANQKTLANGITKRAKRHLNNGITTIEVKSGYGLSVKEELKMLRAIKEANNNIRVDLVPTCLAAHILPKDFKGSEKLYLEEISTTLFPMLKEEKLAHRIDAFVEQTAFSKTAIGPYFKKAKEMGFDITVHADQFTTSGSTVAVEYGAISADHLEASTENEIELLAKSNVIATALPGASMGLGCDYAPARKILDAGGALAIASDWNPGSAPMGDLLTQSALLGAFEKLTNTEVLTGITLRAAAALNLNDRGRLAKGHLADMVAFPSNNYKEILYHQGALKPSMIWKKGHLAVEKKLD